MPLRNVHGIVLLDKPVGLSSNQALQAVRRLLRAEKGGHTGTLDPLASGLLPLCFGEATKLAGNLLGARKAYVAECRLGVTTDTADGEGEVLRERPVPVLDSTSLETAFGKFRGSITQSPPIFSALKQGGERLYVKARRGEKVDVPPRSVEVYRLELIGRTAGTLTLQVECGTGTYIRSLVSDLGEDLGCGAYVSALRRLWVEPFCSPQMVTLAELERAAAAGDSELLRWVLPVAAGLAGHPGLHFDPAQSAAIARGRQIVLSAPHPLGRCAAFGSNRVLLAVIDVDHAGRVQVVRGFNLPPDGEFAAVKPNALVEVPGASVE
ncbi:MAG: tRNA pseudouridine(55) synthase TruB [Rhodanobacter sp.]